VNADELYEEALKLPMEERITLARRLLASSYWHGESTPSSKVLDKLKLFYGVENPSCTQVFDEDGGDTRPLDQRMHD